MRGKTDRKLYRSYSTSQNLGKGTLSVLYRVNVGRNIDPILSEKHNETSHLRNSETDSFKLLTAKIEGNANDARALCDSFKAKFADGVAVFAAVSDGRLNFAAAAGADAVKAGAHAGNILKEISVICGGKGGGRPDSAMSGGKDIDKIPEALAEVEKILLGI